MRMTPIAIDTNAPANASTSRRQFLKTAAVATGGLMIGFYLPGANKFANAQGAGKKPVYPPNAFLRIDKDNIVTVVVKHQDMGQGVLTSLPMLVAEELDCDWGKVRSELAPAAMVYAHTMFGLQMTGGSSSLNNSFAQMRTVGAMARDMLISAAAMQWNVDHAACTTAQGYVLGPNGKKASYGSLAEAANKLPLPEKVALKDAKSFRIIGKSTRRIDGTSKGNGSALFGIDVTAKMVPGLMIAVVRHAPVFGAKVKSVNAAKALASPGVTQVVQTSNAVAVIAKTFWQAKQARDLLEVEWNMDGAAKVSTADMRKDYLEKSRTTGAMVKKADAPEAINGAAKTLVAEYELPYLAHAPMEPLNCTVRLTADSCELWVGSQFQTIDQGAAARAAGMKPEQVKLNTMLAGGGFGRRAAVASDYIIEAVQIAKQVNAPVKMVWTREEDMKGGFYRPMFTHRVTTGLDAGGKIVGWNHVIVGQSIASGTVMEGMVVKDGIDGFSVEGAADTPYAIPNMQVSLHSPKPGVPVLWWRSVGHSHSAFVMETMMDEAAKATGKDPVAYRRELLAKQPRFLKTLELLAEKASWGSAAPKGRARGIAIHECFGSVVAEMAEVSIEAGKIRVHRVVAAVDCGLVVNPLGVIAQVESSICYGLSAALGGAITLKEGVVEQSNFHDYPPLRMPAMPKVEVYLVEGGTSPTGMGEPATPPIAPAVANALFALTGKRLRTLPFDVSGLA